MKKVYMAPLAEVIKLQNMPLLAAVSGEISGETEIQYSTDLEFEEEEE